MNTARQHETFISYSRQDKEFVLEFAREMKSAGYPAWLDQLDIPTGARWDDEVERALRECKIFLVILTPASVSSENVKDEIGYAIDHGKRIMPVLLKECAIPLRLRRFQYIDFTRMEFSEGIKRAKQLLETLLDEQSTPAGTVNSNYKPQKSPSLKATPVAPLPSKNKPVQRQWIGVGTGILACAACIGVLGAIFLLRGLFPSAPTQVPTAGDIITEQQTEAPSTNPPLTSTVIPTTTAPSIASPIPSTEVPPVTEAPTNTAVPLPTPIIIPTQSICTERVPLNSWYSPNRGDNWVTTQHATSAGQSLSPDYRYVRLEGFICSPDSPQPPETVPLYSWYSPDRGDNWATTQHATSAGQSLSPDYRYVRLEGYIYSRDVPQPPETVPFNSWYSPDRGDNWATTQHATSASQSLSPDYRYVRLEGYVIP